MMKRQFPFRYNLFFVFFASLILNACKPSDRELVEKANQESIEQKAQMAKYLYLQVIQNRSSHDETRLKALEGLVDLSLSQLSDYPTALTALDKIIDEYENEPFFKAQIPDFRFKSAKIYRVNLQKPDRAYEMISPLLKRNPPFQMNALMLQELGRIQMARREYKDGERFLLEAFEVAKDCGLLKSLQLDLVQNYSLAKNCERALDWSAKSLPNKCVRDDYSLAIERAHCYETSGESEKAIHIYEQMISESPKNTRIHFMLQSLKQRLKEKQRK